MAKIWQSLAKFARQLVLMPICLFCLFASHSSLAIDTVELLIDNISIKEFISQSSQEIPVKNKLLDKSSGKNAPQLFKHLNIDQLTVSLDITSSPISLKVDVTKLELPPPFNKISTLNISCNNFLAINDEVICEEGRLSFKGIVDQAITKAFFKFEYNIINNDFSVTIGDANIGSGSISASFRVDAGQWLSKIDIKNLDYELLKPYINYLVTQDNNTSSNISSDELEAFGGILSLSGNLSGRFTNNTSNTLKNNSTMSIDHFKLSGDVKNVRYEFGDDLAEQLAFQFDLNGHSISNKQAQKVGLSENYHVSLSANALAGEVIQNDLYIVLKGHEKLHLNFDYFHQHSINFSRFDINAGNVFSLNSKGYFLLNDLGKPIQQLSTINLKLKSAEMSKLTEVYLDDILSGTDYEGLQVEGGLSVSIDKNAQLIKTKAQFNDFSLAFSDEVSLIGLTGDVFWDNKKRKNNNKSSVPTSLLSWQELSLDQLPLGPSSFKFILHNDYMSLLKETDIPIFDGALHLNSLELTQFFHELSDFITINPQIPVSKNKSALAFDGLTLTVDGMIKPVSMGLVSEHFAWPKLEGTLSAVIPETTYNEKHLIVGGALMLQLFDGVIIVKDLVINEPLDDYAQLFANIDLNNLNLQPLTRTYNFGEIQGRVEGKLQGLELVAWEPVAFDAYIRTPKDDNSRHRISQRAIDNLSSLGGASGLLSRSFLSFFETFRYSKIGLSCKLKNDICLMSGVEDKGNSYYIVKGGGLPRIDVMGFQNQVNWKVLTTRLKAIQQANEAVIE